MRKLCSVVLCAAVFTGIATAERPAAAAVQQIEPVVILPPVDITFDPNLVPPGNNPFLPPSGRTVEDIIRSHNLARQQVQAAIAFLVSNRRSILEGKNDFYNSIFGGFYDPDNEFAGQYDRTIQVPIFDGFGNIIGFEERINPAHLDTVLNTFLSIQAALEDPTTYALGGPTFDPLFNAYISGDPIVGDLLFGAGPLTNTGLTRGFRKWGNSNSISRKHLDQLRNDPNNPLLWTDDNDEVFLIDPRTGMPFIDPVTGLPISNSLLSFPFLREKLDAYTQGGGTVFVGGAFLNELTRPGGLEDGSPQSLLVPTEFNQYQMIISAFAEQFGAEPGLSELFGDNPQFTQAFDSNSYGAFSDVFVDVQDGGVGDGTLLPPLGKNGVFSGNFLPVLPGA